MIAYVILFVILLAGILAFVVVSRVKERRYLKKSLPEVIEPRFYEEITGEEAETQRRQEKFSQILKKHQS